MTNQPHLPQDVEEFIAAHLREDPVTIDQFIDVDDLRAWMADHVRVPVELIRFLEAKEHHLLVEDRHALSAMLNASKGE